MNMFNKNVRRTTISIFLLLMLYVGLWCEAAVAGSYVMDEKGEREEGSKNK